MALLKPDSLGAQVVERVKQLRQARRWSTRRLAQELHLLGYDWITREILANLENMRRAVVTVDELAAFGAVFGVDPWSLTDVDRRCPRCEDTPPAGYSCTLCGNTGPDPIETALRIVGEQETIP